MVGDREGADEGWAVGDWLGGFDGLLLGSFVGLYTINSQEIGDMMSIFLFSVSTAS